MLIAQIFDSTISLFITLGLLAKNINVMLGVFEKDFHSNNYTLPNLIIFEKKLKALTSTGQILKG